jgi:hypothetical protein
MYVNQIYVYRQLNVSNYIWRRKSSGSHRVPSSSLSLIIFRRLALSLLLSAQLWVWLYKFLSAVNSGWIVCESQSCVFPLAAVLGSRLKI